MTGPGGNKVSNKDLKESYYLIYFGFTKCPEICPTTLRDTSSILRIFRTLPKADTANLKMVFVSVDPQRDTPESIKQYLSMFDSEIIGVTGKSESDPALLECMKNFKIYATRIEDPSNPKGYNIDHTAMVFVMTPRNTFLTTLNPTISHRENAQQLLEHILVDMRRS